MQLEIASTHTPVHQTNFVQIKGAYRSIPSVPKFLQQQDTNQAGRNKTIQLGTAHEYMRSNMGTNFTTRSHHTLLHMLCTCRTRRKVGMVITMTRTTEKRSTNREETTEKQHFHLMHQYGQHCSQMQSQLHVLVALQFCRAHGFSLLDTTKQKQQATSPRTPSCKPVTNNGYIQNIFLHFKRNIFSVQNGSQLWSWLNGLLWLNRLLQFCSSSKDRCTGY